MEFKGTEELRTGIFIVICTTIITNRCDNKTSKGGSMKRYTGNIARNHLPGDSALYNI